jgi:hypothetical protein
VALVGRGPAAQVVVYFLFFTVYLLCFYFALNLGELLNLNKIRNLNKFGIWNFFKEIQKKSRI